MKTIETRFFKSEDKAQKYFNSVAAPVDLFSETRNGKIFGYYVEDRCGENRIMSQHLNKHNLISQK